MNDKDTPMSWELQGFRGYFPGTNSLLYNNHITQVLVWLMPELH